MTTTIIPVSADESAPVTIHYYNENSFTSPYLYYYTDSYNPVIWPGAAMTADGDGLYTYESTRIIFSNNGSNQLPVQNQPGLDAEGIMWYKNDIWCDKDTDTDEDELLENSFGFIQSSFHWYPKDSQWWITGFDYSKHRVNADSLVNIGYLDFSGDTDMFESIINSEHCDDFYNKPETKISDSMIFDTENKFVWLIW